MVASDTNLAFLKSRLKPYQDALYHSNLSLAKQRLSELSLPDTQVHLSHPFNTLDCIQSFFEQSLDPLFLAIPDLERRDTIVMAGESLGGRCWVGCCGYYTGVFTKPFLRIPPTGHQVSLRFHEFYCFEGDQLTQIQALWDIPELMMQASVWPMAKTLGREWHVPGPATQDGLHISSSCSETSVNSKKLVADMLTALGQYAKGGVDAMQLERYWHPSFSWYGPSGIGTARGVDGFRQCHQIPFLNALPDRVAAMDKGDLFAEGEYVAFTAWPGMYATVSGDGWLGIAPSGQKISLRSLDFWRCEQGLIRENWVLVDLLHVFDQVGVDVLSRMVELSKAWR